MKKFAHLLLLALMLPLPIANAQDDWKEYFLKEFDYFLYKLNQKIESTPGVELSKRTRLFQLSTLMASSCIGLSEEGIAIDNDTVQLSVEVHRQLLLGQKIPRIEKIKEIGLSCLISFEKEMLKEGIPKNQIDALMIPILELVISNMSLRFGLE